MGVWGDHLDIFDSGIGISILLAGKAFISVEHIVNWRRSFFGDYILHHDSPELRNPLILPSGEIIVAVQDMISKHRKYLT
jgi:hypothetical protein